jgi:hypothetical protein
MKTFSTKIPWSSVTQWVLTSMAENTQFIYEMLTTCAKKVLRMSGYDGVIELSQYIVIAYMYRPK